MASAYAIGVKGWLFLVAGYKPELVKDKAGLARWMGGGLSVIGTILFGLGITLIMAPRLWPIAVGVLPAIGPVGAGLLYAGAQRYRA